MYNTCNLLDILIQLKDHCDHIIFLNEQYQEIKEMIVTYDEDIAICNMVNESVQIINWI